MLTPLAATPTTSLLGATSAFGLAACPPTLHERAPSCSSSPSSLGSSPASRGLTVHVSASTFCPPKSGTRAGCGAGTTRFAPALSKRKTGKRRGAGGGGGGGGGSSGDDDIWGDYDVWSSGPWDGFDELSGGGGGGRGRYGGGGGGRGGFGGGGGWDRSNSEFGDWPALAGAGWLWQGICAASLVHSLFFLMFPHKAAERSVPRSVEGLC
jgi:hypothetical protein